LRSFLTELQALQHIRTDGSPPKENEKTIYFLIFPGLNKDLFTKIEKENLYIAILIMR
jgi:hypothetical protein